VYCGNNPLTFTDPTGLWIENTDGSWTAEKNDTLSGWSKKTGLKWEETNFSGDPKKLKVGQKISHIPTEIDKESEKEGYSTVSYLDGKVTATLPYGLEYNIELEGKVPNNATINVAKNTTIELTRKDKDRFNFSINGEFKLPEIYGKANALESMLEDYTMIGFSASFSAPPLGGGFGLGGFKSYNRVTG